MINLQQIKNLLYKAGVIPDILIFSGWAYACILFIVLFINIIFLIIEFFKNKKNYL